MAPERTPSEVSSIPSLAMEHEPVKVPHEKPLMTASVSSGDAAHPAPASSSFRVVALVAAACTRWLRALNPTYTYLPHGGARQVRLRIAGSDLW